MSGTSSRSWPGAGPARLPLRVTRSARARSAPARSPRFSALSPTANRSTAPSLAVYDVFGAHLRKHGAPAHALFRVAAHELEVALGGLVSALLQVSVAQPLGVMVGSPVCPVAPGRELVLRHD